MQECVEKIDKNQLKGLNNVEEMFGFILDFWGKSLFKSEEQFKELINFLINTQKGMSKTELLSATKMES